MQQPGEEAAIRRAAALLLHWYRNDMQALVMSMSEIASLDEATDVITGLLLLQGRSPEMLADLILRTALKEAY